MKNDMNSSEVLRYGYVETEGRNLSPKTKMAEIYVWTRRGAISQKETLFSVSFGKGQHLRLAEIIVDCRGLGGVSILFWESFVFGCFLCLRQWRSFYILDPELKMYTDVTTAFYTHPISGNFDSVFRFYLILKFIFLHM